MRLMARMAKNRVPRRSFLAAAGLIGGSAALAACTPGGSSSSAAPSGAAPSGAPASGGRRQLRDRRRAVHVQLVRLRRPANMEAFKAEFGVKNFVYDTFANNDELLAKLAGRRVRLRLRLPDGRVHAADGRRGLHPEAGLQPDPQLRSTSIRPSSARAGTRTTSTTSRRTTARRASCTARRSSPSRSRRGGVLRPRGRQVQRQGRPGRLRGRRPASCR